MAYAETKRNNVKFYGLTLSYWVENISNSTARIHWGVSVDFGDWYYYGVRAHVRVGGVERYSQAGVTYSSYKTAVSFSGTTDAARNDNGYNVWCEAWTTSETVNGYGGCGSTASCGGNAWIPAIDYVTPDAPSDLQVESSSETRQVLKWTLPANTGKKQYNSSYLYRHVNDGGTETLYNSSIISNYTDSTTKAGNKYAYDTRVMGKNGQLSEMSNAVVIYTAPTAVEKLSIAKNADNTVTVTTSGLPRYYDGIQFQASIDNWKTAHDVALSGDTDRNPLGGTVQYRARAYKEKPVNGGGETVYAPWTYSNSITTLCAPNAPAVAQMSPVYRLASDGTASILLGWNPNHPDGTACSGSKMELSVDGGTSTVSTVQGTSRTLGASGVHTYRFRVCTIGAAEYGYGAWSEWVEFSTAYAPTAYFSTPGTDSFELNELPFTVAWVATDSTGIVDVSVSLVDQDGNTVASYHGDGKVSAWLLNGYSSIKNNQSYTLRGAVRNGKGLTTEFARKFTTAWSVPAPPVVAIAYNDDLSATIVTQRPQTSYEIKDTAVTGPISRIRDGLFMAGAAVVYESEITIDNPAMCVRFDMARVNPDGSTTPLITGADVGTFVFDRLPPLNTDYTYSVTAYAESGAFVTFEVPAYCDSFGDEAFNFGDSGETCLRLGYDASVSRTKKYPGNTFHFARGRNGSPLPTFYPDGDLDVAGSYSYVSYGRDAYDRAERITEKPENAVCWFRSAFGRTARVAVETWGLGYDAKNYSLWSIAPSLIEVEWEEPLR